MPAITSSLFFARLLSACTVAYGLGCLNTGYYFVRLRTGQDIRALGSGNAGARNVGRVFDKFSLVVTLLGDLLKGTLAVALASWLGLPLWGQSLAALAVVAGHIWPLQLQGRGGKGAATALGAMLVLNVWVGIGAIVCALLLAALSRRVTISGLIAMGMVPLLALWLVPSLAAVAVIVLLVGLLLYAHRENFQAIAAAQPR